MTEALVTPAVLTWARHRRGLDTSKLAAKLNVKTEAVDAWESGERKPTFRQARQLSQALYVPFGYLFLSEPPVQELPIHDFRTAVDQIPREPSPNLLDLLNDVYAKQQWFREYREASGRAELPFVGRTPLSASIEALAESEVDVASADIGQTLDFGSARSRAKNQDDFLRQLTINAEKSGIMVMRSGVVGNNVYRPLDVEEFRGFAISDEIAPLIFINSRDHVDAQVSTFAHELTHLWLKEGGVCNPRRPEDLNDPVEGFCNQVARGSLEQVEDSRIARKFSEVNYRVSNVSMHMISFTDDPKPANNGIAGSLEPAGKRSGAFCQMLTARNGIGFTAAVISSAADGALLSREAADMLGVKVKTLPAIAEHLFGNPLALA